ncbi:MAG: IS630 family transposase, partial [Planctomycetota bacterium]
KIDVVNLLETGQFCVFADTEVRPVKALDMDLRERILAAVLEGNESMPKIAERFSVSYKVVQKLKYQWRDLGTLQPQTHHCGRKRAFSEKQSKKLDRLIRENPSWTIEQLRQKLRMDCTIQTVWNEARWLGHSFKKTLRATEQRRDDVRQKRDHWKRNQKRLDIEKLVFLDATGAKTNMTRLYGWGPKCQRVEDDVPHGHWETTTLIRAIDCHGSRASMITNCPTNSWVFEGFVDWLLAPALRSGDILAMNNLSSHKNASALEKIRETGVEVWFLPSYSPDLNPIEQIFQRSKRICEEPPFAPNGNSTTPSPKPLIRLLPWIA